MVDHHRIVAEIPSLRRYARALTGSADAADDLVQDCLERACSRWHLWQTHRALRPWLFTIMRNLFISDRRREARRPRMVPVDDDSPGLVSAPSQEPHLDVSELVRALPRLSVDQREVVLLVGLEGMSYAEAALITGVPIGTVMSRLARGRERLRQVLTGDETPRVRRVK